MAIAGWVSLQSPSCGQDTSIKLTGVIIGTPGSYINNPAVTKEAAMDGDLATYYDAANNTGDWVGLDLGETNIVVTKIKFSARPFQEGRMNGGVFQGSDTPDFSSGVATLFTITGTPPSGAFTTVSLTTNLTPFRYVRYLGPVDGSCNVAEIEFWGELNAAPTAPSGFDAFPASNGQIQLRWNPSSLAASYTLQRAETSGGPYVIIATGLVSTEFLDTDADAGQRHYYLVSATNDLGQSANSSLSYEPFIKVFYPVIGTTGSWNNNPSSTKAAAMDGKLDTYYDAINATGDWVGVDLGSESAFVIKQIKYCPRGGSFHLGRMNGGMFQASNTPDFSSGVVTLFTITGTPAEGTLTTVPLANSNSFRYLRYLGPPNGFCNVAEIEFGGVPLVAPDAPNGFAAFGVGAGQIELKWNPSTLATSYTLQRGDVSGGPYVTIATGLVSTNYLDSGLVAGQTHYYVVSATNNLGQSADSLQASATASSGPNGEWEFNEGSGVLAADSSSFRNDGVVNGATWTAGFIGTALQFDGADSFVTLGTGPAVSGTNNFTISAWIKTISIKKGIIIQQRDSGGFNGEYIFSFNPNGSLQFMVFGDSDYQFDFRTKQTINDGAWHHVVAVRDGAVGNIYIDGNPTPAATATGPVRNLDPTLSVAIGRDIRDNSNFRGAFAVDEVQIYNTIALTGAEVESLYASYNAQPFLDLNGVSPGEDVNAIFDEGTPVVIAPRAIIGDVNKIESLTARLTERPDGDAVESLSLNRLASDIALIDGLTVTYSESTGVLHVSGREDDSTYQLILRGIQYNNLSHDPTRLLRTVIIEATKHEASVPRIATIIVREANDAPIAVDDVLGPIAEDSGALTIEPDALLANDINEAGQRLTIASVANAVGGSVSLVGTQVQFVPASDYFGEASFTYTVTDDGRTAGAPDPKTATATVRFTIREVNDPPVVNPANAGSVAEDGAPLAIPQSIFLQGSSAGPPNEQGQTLILAGVQNGVGGTVSIVGTNVEFTPSPNFFGTATFTFTIQDNGTTLGVADPKTMTATASVVVLEVNDPPTANAVTLSAIAEDSGTRIIPAALLTANDSPGPNESGQSLTIIAVSGTVGGSATLSGQNVLFTPATNFNGRASFQYIVQDNGTTEGTLDPKTAAATVDFQITEVNDPPRPQPDVLPPVAEDFGSRTIPAATLLANDSPGPANEATQTLTIVSVSAAIGGTVALVGDQIVFTSETNFFGAAGFTYTVQDDGATAGVIDSQTASAQVTFTVNRQNDPPMALNDTLNNISEDSPPLVIPVATLLANDSTGPANETNQILTIVAVGSPLGGTVSLVGTNVIFTPTANYNGPARFNYTVQDDGASAGSPDPRAGTATVSFTIVEVNDPPIAEEDFAGAMHEDGPALVIPLSSLLADDAPGPANESGQALTIISVTAGTGGTPTIVGTNIIFTAETNFNGFATFTYTVQDNGTTAGVTDPKTATAVVTVRIDEVNDPPVASPVALSDIPEDSGARTIPFSAITFDAVPGPANESGQTVTVTGVSGAVGGSASISGTNILFTPAADYFGPASFQCTIRDNGTTDGAPDAKTASVGVSFVIKEVNDPPIAHPNTFGAIAEDSGPLVIPFATLLADDLPGPPNETNQTLTIVSVGNAVGGSVTISSGNIVFTPAPDYNGPASFTYVAQDDGTTAGVADPKTGSATVSFTITSVNDPPVVVNDTLSSIAEDSGPRLIPFSQLLANDLAGPSDEQTQTLTIAAVGAAVGGTVSIIGTNVVFVPTPDYFGPASFSYTARDDGFTRGVRDVKTASGTVSFTITEVNDAPIPQVALHNDVFEDSVLVIPISEFLANDVPGPPNESNQTLTMIAVGGAVGGTVTIEGTNVVMTLATNFNGLGRFFYTVRDNGTTDGQPDFKTATATIVNPVIPVNDPPVAQSASFAVKEDGVDGITLRGDDGDPDVVQALTFAITAQPQHGTISAFDAATGGLIYTPDTNYRGPDSFQFTVTDDDTAGDPPALTSAPATINLTVSPAADAPTVTPATTQEGKQTTDGLVITRNAVDGPEVTHFKISRIQNGTLFLNDGVTTIAEGAFITAAEGSAGLRFTPTAGLYSPGVDFGFDAQAGLDASGSGLSAPTAAVITVEPNLDWGDAPGTYPVVQAKGGARHVVLSTGATLFLGANPPDTETDGQPSAAADGDNNSASNDEDGVVVPDTIVAGQNYSLQIVSSEFGLINAWIDWNQDGDWNDVGEQILVDRPVAAGTNSFQLIAPASVLTGASFARFRLSTQSGLGPGGLASDGEVEDYVVNLVTNTAPVAVADSYTVAEGGTLIVSVGSGVLANDSDNEANPLNVTLAVGPSFDASFQLNSDGSFTYAHNGSENFTDSFTYLVNDGFGGVASGVATITITEVNDPPVAVNDTLADRLEDSAPLVIPFADLLDNDSPGLDETNQVLAIISVGNPVGGSVTISGGNVIFTSTPDYNGPASFTYVAQDDGTTSGVPNPLTTSATVSWRIAEVNDPPLPHAVDLGDIGEDSPPVAIPIAALLANDSPGPLNEAGQTLRIAGADGAIGGSITLTDTEIIFTPAANYFGSAGFNYVVEDNGTTDGAPDAKSATISVTLNIFEVNDAPAPLPGVLAATTEDFGERIIPTSLLLFNDSPGANETNQTLAVVDVGNAAGGTVRLVGANVIFTAQPDFNGIAQFTYTAEDNGTTDGVSDPKRLSATVSFRVFEINDPPVAHSGTLQTIPENSADLIIPMTNLTGNDLPGPPNESDQTLTVVAVSDAVGGSCRLEGTNIIFTPAHGFNGTAGFVYTAQDNGTSVGQPDPKTAEAAVTFLISEVNDPPAPEDDILPDVAEDSSDRVIPFTTLLANDAAGPANESNQTLTIIEVRNAVGGSVRIEGVTVIFTPNPDFNGPAGFSYVVQDDGTTAAAPDPKTAVAQVSFGITEVDDPPVAVADRLSDINEDSPARAISFNELLANDSVGPANENGQTLTIVAVGNVIGGGVTLRDSDILFTPDANFNGEASFIYTITDDGTTSGHAEVSTAQATVSFNIREVNDSPLVLNDQYTSDVDEDSGVQTIPIAFLLANDAPGPPNESAQTLTLLSVSNEVGGTFTISGTNILYTPASNFNGTAHFTYIVQDNGTTAGLPDPKTGSATFSLVVNPVNDSPVAVDDQLADINEDSGNRIIPAAILLANDNRGPANEASQTLTLVGVSNSVGGTATIVGGDVVFSPATNYFGEAGFDYAIQDDGKTSGLPDPKSSTARVTFAIKEVNDPPIANDDVLPAVLEDSPPRTIPISLLLANDVPGPANELATQTLTITSVESELGGTVELSGTNVIFTLAPDFSGHAFFVYVVQDNGTTGGTLAPRTAQGVVSFQVIGVADIPNATAATTFEAQQTTSGLALKPNAADDGITHFKITAIQNGKVFLSDGRTEVADGEFVTEADGAAGLKFTPTPGLYSPLTNFQFSVQAAFDATGAGLSDATIATIEVEPNVDLGDAPDPLYPTEIASDGARHVVLSTGSTLYLGTIPPDAELSGQSTDGDGDNNNGVSDEDGVLISAPVRAGHDFTLTVTATGSGFLNAWIDWNRDGNWNDAGEQVLTNEPANNQTNTYTLSAPAFVGEGRTFARFRFSSVGNLQPIGLAPDGEVEDYALTLATNSIPVAQGNTIVRYAGESAKISEQEALANDSDPDGDALTLVTVPGLLPSGARVVRDNGWIVYLPPAGFDLPDTFNYTVSDGHGGISQGTIQVNVTGVAPALQLTSVTIRLVGDAVVIQFVGIPGESYEIQSTSDLSSPWTLEPGEIRAADPSGAISITTAPTSEARFYRARQL